MQSELHEPHQPETRKRRSLFFWLGRVLVTLMGLTLLLMLLIHLPPVQRWGIGKITTSIANVLNTRVELDGFSLHPVSDLTLRGIFIGSPDHPGDTLLYAEKLHVDYRRIWDILSKRMWITQLAVENGFLNIHRLPGDSLTNLDIALNRLLPSANPDKPAFVLELETLSARSLKVHIDDEVTGALMELFFRTADIQINEMDITGKYISIRELDLESPVIRMTSREATLDTTQLAVESSSDMWSFDIEELRLSDGRFVTADKLREKNRYPDPRGIDFGHMNLEDINIRIDSFAIRGWDFNGKDIDMRMKHRDGLEIRSLAAGRASVTSEGVFLKDLRLITPDSRIENTVNLLFSGYTDFQSFVDSVRLDIPVADIHIRIADLMAIVPGLQTVDFFAANAEKDIRLQGHVSGHINRLRILNMEGSFGPLELTGDFRSRDLAVKGSQLLSLDLKQATFSARAIQSIFPSMKVPELLTRLGQIRFTGKFDGYPDDFVAFGTFHTLLGAISLDMNLNTARGIADGKYSGSIGMKDFDLGTFTGQADLGRVSMTGRVIEGRGLTSSSIYADITSQVSALTYKGYTYRNARIDGQFSGRRFNGTMDIRDPNMDMSFEGFIDLAGVTPRMDFISRIESIRFQELGLTENATTLSGIFDVDLSVGKLSDIHGAVHGENIILTRLDTTFILDSLHVIAVVDSATNLRSYTISSDLLSGHLQGMFDPELLSGEVQHYLHSVYPDAIDAPDKEWIRADQQQMSWDIRIHNSRHWLDLIGFKSLNVRNVHTIGQLDLIARSSSGSIDLPEIHYGRFNAYSTTIQFKENNGILETDMELIAADVNESFFFEDVLISGVATNDSVRMNFKTDHLADIIDELNLNIDADPQGGVWNISLNPIRLVMLGDNWQIPTGNKVEIRKDGFNLENLELISANGIDRRIMIDDIDQKGIEAYISGFDISYLNELWINDKFKFSGLYTLELEIDNIYDIRQMNTQLHIPAMQINNVPYGEWQMQAIMNEPRDSVQLSFTMEHNETSLTAKGAYLPPIKAIDKADQNYLRMAVTTNEFPLDFLEFLLGGNIRDTEGSVDMDLTLVGKTNMLSPNGKGIVNNGSTTIDYLGVAYSFHNQSFTITESMIDLSGAILYDVLGNTAVVEGGMTHRYLRDLGLQATLTSPRILALDVTSEENTVFYGRGIGSVFARFSGTVANPNMQIQLGTARGTHIYIPLSGGAASTDRDFVVFLENGRLPVTPQTQINLGGINLTINMSITEDATIEIIFDDNTGEVLRAVGQGDLQLAMTRTGNFTMYGNYVIEQGDYLFTNFRVVRKPFELVRGGTISWDGDPYSANLNVQAKYKGLTAPVYRLIEEYLITGSNTSLNDQARERTDVDLTMTLTGSLLQPNISFDIAFPNLTGEVKGYTDSKINSLRSNENAMLEQVMGLLITRSFLPPSSSSSSGGLLYRGIDNTLSELISATLSSYLGGLLGNLIPQGTFLSGIDFSVGLDLPITSGGIIDQSGQLEDLSATEVEFDLPLKFFNDRLSLNVGGNYVTGASVGPASEYWAGDITFEYDITPDRRLKVRAYNRNTMTVEGRRNKVGLGLAYRREYNNLAEFFGRKKKEPAKASSE